MIVLRWRVIVLRWRVIVLRWRVIVLRWRVIVLRWRVIVLRWRVIVLRDTLCRGVVVRGIQGTEAAVSVTQSGVNGRMWRSGRFLRAYDNRVLIPGEVRLLVRYSSYLSGRVLDLGCGAGRVLYYLVMLGADAHGLDLSVAMVEHCRRTIPEATVVQGDLATLTEHVEGRFRMVLAPNNLLDVFNDAERRHVLGQIREILDPDGVLIFSSHDLAHLENPHQGGNGHQRAMLRKLLTSSPHDIARSASGQLISVRNHRRLGPLQERHDDYAIVNDASLNYSLLHYYIRRDDQEKQLNELGFELLECIDTEGAVVPPGASGPTDYLHYVARPI